jgi:predicted nucleotidyltransferase
VAELCAALGAQAGIEAVAIGGSRAAGTADDASDWDIGFYYRGQVDLATLARYGEVHSWSSRSGSTACTNGSRVSRDRRLR